MHPTVSLASLRFAARPTKVDKGPFLVSAGSNMRRLLLLVFLFTPCPLLAQSPAAARLALQKGNYAEAEELYEELVKQPKFAVVAALGLSRAQEAQGNYDAALAAVDAGLKKDEGHADLLGRRAELLFERGRWDDAKQAAALALKKSPDHLLAR